jgi:hypothetical protein
MQVYGDEARHMRFLKNRGLVNEKAGASSTWQITQAGREEIVSDSSLFDRERIHARWCHVKEPLEKALSPLSRTYVRFGYEYLQPWEVLMEMKRYHNDESEWISRNLGLAMELLKVAIQWLRSELDPESSHKDQFVKNRHDALCDILKVGRMAD